MDYLKFILVNQKWKNAFEIQKRCIEKFNEITSLIFDNNVFIPGRGNNKIKLADNIFSTLFIAVSATLGLTDEELEFYAVLNHCLRTLVTGCDNIFDSEYKEVIPLSLPGSGTIFKSVLHIIAAEKIISHILIENINSGIITSAKAGVISKAALSVIMPSGVEEHEEETGVRWTDTDAGDVIENILYRKTGVLFEAPVKLIQAGEGLSDHAVALQCSALASFGIACQLLDDVMDTAEDLYNKKNNAVASSAAGFEDEKLLIDNLEKLDAITFRQALETSKQLKKSKRECIRKSFRYFRKTHQLFKQIAPEFAGREFLLAAAAARRQIMSDRNLSR